MIEAGGRGAAGTVAGCCAAVLAVAGAQPDRLVDLEGWSRRIAADPTQAVALAAGSLAWLLLGWLALGVALSAAAGLPGLLGRVGGRVAARLVPGVLRHVVELTLGLTVTVTGAAGLAVPAAASAAHAAPASASAAAPSLRLQLPDPGEPVTPVRPAPGRATTPTPTRAAASTAGTGQLPDPTPPARAPDPEGAVVVHAGDCLWDLALSQLAAGHPGHTPTDAEVAAEWPRWWQANAAVVGHDPDLLLPGQRLTPPH